MISELRSKLSSGPKSKFRKIDISYKISLYFKLTYKMIQLEVTCSVFGYDHDDIWSGEEANEQNEINYEEVVVWDVCLANGVVYLDNCYNKSQEFTSDQFNRLLLGPDISELDFRVEGCSSIRCYDNYCNDNGGFYREYTATKVKFIEQ